METIIAYTAGGAKGNPGPAAAGVYITDAKGKVVREVKQSLGNATSDFAEYYGVMLVLQTLQEIYNKKSKKIQFEIRLSSELVQKQLSALEPIKEPGLVPMFIEIHNMKVASFPYISFVHINRAKNKEADRLVNEVLGNS
ncbi:MAG TPA: ribonuclease HI family protein [Candidatus Paceibacterota bacterium]|nr:ribonuclease HI family protein [Candidatus Paceibacterota bacterium]